jgi:hypothetical protein
MIVVYYEIGSNELGTRAFMTGDGRIVDVEPGAEAPFYLQVAEPVADAVAQAIAPRPEASARHLDDAILIRDEALAMVQQFVTSWTRP